MRVRLLLPLLTAAAAVAFGAIPATAATSTASVVATPAAAPQCTFTYVNVGYYQQTYTTANCTADAGQSWQLRLDCWRPKTQEYTYAFGPKVTGSGSSTASCGVLVNQVSYGIQLD
ncbi:hypothetical protein [Kitasatospora viridis]|uniref:Alpha amylase inhibitor n=1 Tax=Kitasatospora viridis TaxID=281105 RepID=A0A561TVA0_9ACTN|nr:hypothetical protein [Kitasatospora viridis]TWF91046.1 hypothetical protein FHX73_12158 [Kitasatospora viridis]